MLKKESQLISVPVVKASPCPHPIPVPWLCKRQSTRVMGTEPACPHVPCPKPPCCSVLWMSGDVGLKMHPDGRRRSPMSAGELGVRPGQDGAGEAELAEEECGLRGGTGTLTSAGWGRGISWHSPGAAHSYRADRLMGAAKFA